MIFYTLVEQKKLPAAASYDDIFILFFYSSWLAKGEYFYFTDKQFHLIINQLNLVEFY